MSALAAGQAGPWECWLEGGSNIPCALLGGRLRSLASPCAQASTFLSTFVSSAVHSNHGQLSLTRPPFSPSFLAASFAGRPIRRLTTTRALSCSASVSVASPHS